MKHAEPGSCSYELGMDFGIVAVDEAWSAFAIANGAPELVPPGPLGRSVLSYISDPTTTLLYERLFAKVQRTGTAVVVPFRCDSPSLRRFLTLRIEPCASSGWQLHSTLLRVEPRPAVRWLEPHQAQDDTILMMCSFCKCIEVDGHWREVEQAVASLQLFEREVLPMLGHGVCPPCMQRALDLLAK